MEYPVAIKKLVYFFSQLPGVGPRTAERYVFSLLNKKQEIMLDFAQALVELNEHIKYCEICNCIADTETCYLCISKDRDRSLLCVISDSRDMLTIESTGRYKGLYFSLGGIIDTSRGINPDALASGKLVEYIKLGTIKEVILAFNSNMEGETTAMYVAKLINTYDVKVTRLARGLPMGASLDYADEMTLNNAFKYRNVV
ncbi:recombination protein RecR [Patescibacteria group bacterium]|nr:recombination protein RecR [Patescibacteria group bacterium]